jgi:DNA-directed RNA polymerase subunit M/transcription elongation factor TFIIS
MQQAERQTDATWQRIHANQEKNTRMLFEAGLRPEEIRPAACPACGSHENALYWTVTRRIGRTLFLRCPICEQGTARYRLDRNRSAYTVLTRTVLAVMAGLLLAAGTLIYYRDSALVQVVVEEVYDASATMGGNAGRPAVYAGGLGGPGAAAGVVFVAAGDRRPDLDRYAAWILERDGEQALRQMLSVRYDPSRAETRVVVDSASLAWPRRLHRLRGWRQLE